MLRLYIPVLLLLLYIEASFFDPQSKIFDPVQTPTPPLSHACQQGMQLGNQYDARQQGLVLRNSSSLKWSRGPPFLFPRNRNWQRHFIVCVCVCVCVCVHCALFKFSCCTFTSGCLAPLPSLSSLVYVRGGVTGESLGRKGSDRGVTGE